MAMSKVQSSLFAVLLLVILITVGVISYIVIVEKSNPKSELGKEIEFLKTKATEFLAPKTNNVLNNLRFEHEAQHTKYEIVRAFRCKDVEYEIQNIQTAKAKNAPYLASAAVAMEKKHFVTFHINSKMDDPLCGYTINPDNMSWDNVMFGNVADMYVPSTHGARNRLWQNKVEKYEKDSKVPQTENSYLEGEQELYQTLNSEGSQIFDHQKFNTELIVNATSLTQPKYRPVAEVAKPATLINQTGWGKYLENENLYENMKNSEYLSEGMEKQSGSEIIENLITGYTDSHNEPRAVAPNKINEVVMLLKDADSIGNGFVLNATLGSEEARKTAQIAMTKLKNFVNSNCEEQSKKSCDPEQFEVAELPSDLVNMAHE